MPLQRKSSVPDGVHEPSSTVCEGVPEISIQTLYFGPSCCPAVRMAEFFAAKGLRDIAVSVTDACQVSAIAEIDEMVQLNAKRTFIDFIVTPMLCEV